MKLVEVVAVEDRSRAEGGHAVILLRGVERAPPGVTFNLTPMVAEDDEETEPPVPGLTGLRALEVTMTADGMALAIGPDIAESALFVPGAAVEITLPDVGVRGEFPWPAVTPLARPKRRNIMLKRNSADPLLRQSPAAPAVETVQPEAPGSSVQMQPQLASEAPADVPETTGHLPTQSSGRRPIVLSSTLPRRAIPDRAPDRENDPAPQAEPETPTASALSPIAAVRSPGAHTLPAQAEIDPAPASTPASTPAPTPIRTTAPTPAMIEPARHEVAQPGPAVDSSVAADAIAAPEGLRPAARTSQAAQQPSRRAGGTMSAGSAVALTAAVLVAGQIIALRALNLSVVPRQSATTAATTAGNEPIAAARVADPVPTHTPAPDKAQPGGPPAPEVPPLSQRNVYEVIAAGPLSPRGVAAAGVTPAKSLQLAHGLLHGPEAERDAEEAAYWLKHYLAGAQGGDSVRIALTQLGSAYAQPVRGERDFASARIVWELSAALGDTVAMCFLGAMHEHGLGGPRTGNVAATWYERASALGRTCATSGHGAGSERR